MSDFVVFVVRCRYVWNGPDQPAGIGYLDAEGRITTAIHQVRSFVSEAEAWDHARASGERCPEDAWVEGGWMLPNPAGLNGGT